MITAVLQCLAAALNLCFGAAALRIAHLTPGEGVRSSAWLLVGVTMTLSGISNAFQKSWALWAVAAGPEATVYRVYLDWMSAMNQGRHGIMLAMAVLLFGLQWLHRIPRARLVWATGGIMLSSAVVAGWFGKLAGEPRWAEHYLTVAALDGIEMMLLFGGLLVALVAGSMDRLLWIALVVYAARQAFNVLSFSATAWIEVPGAWSPSPQHIAWTSLLLWTVLLSLALRRLSLAHRSRESPALLEPYTSRLPSTIS